MLTQMFSEAVPKGHATGTERLVSPKATVARVRPLLHKLGITRVANVTGLDYIGLPVTMVCRPNSRSLAVSQGKGLTQDAAQASGVMEALELFHAEHITNPLKFASYAELSQTHSVVDVVGLPFCTSTRFRTSLPMLWIEGHELRGGSPRWVPYELVNMSAVPPDAPGSGCFVASSNGLASGNHLIEAVIHGLCELIERDSTTLWQLLTDDEQQSRRIDLASVESADCRSVLARFADANIGVIVWDITTDVGVPAFQALIFESDDCEARGVYSAMGMGCHLSPEIALLRALTEAAQSRLTLIAGSRDDVFRLEYEENPDAMQFLLHQVALARARPPARIFQADASQTFPTFNQDLAWLAARLEQAQMPEVVVVDLSKPELGVPVARVIVPGLESYHQIPGFTPGRRAQDLINHRVSS